MWNQNGQLVVQTLDNLEEPSTIGKITKKIADTVGVDVNVVKDSVKETLDGGVRYGFVQRYNKKYFTEPLELVEVADEVPNSSDVHISKMLEDRASRRRRGSRRSSRRRRLGSRRRHLGRRRLGSHRRRSRGRKP